MKTLELLENGVSLETIVSDYKLLATRSEKYQELVLLKYDQLNSPMGERVVQECRGLILNTDTNTVVSRPFDKFFNEGEGHAAKIDWSTAKVQNKLDGSLATLYFYKGEWHVATSGTPHATGKVNGYDITFADLFWQTFKAMGLKLPDEIEPHQATGFCYMFELMTPFNRIVVRHTENKLALIGVRHVGGYGYKEYPVAHYASWGYPVVEQFKLNSLDAVVDTFATMDPMNQEGYVVVDRHFNRIKIKSPAYVALHHMRGNDGPTFKRMLEIVRTNEATEILTYFPEWTPMYNQAKDAYDKFVVDVNTDFHMASVETALFHTDNKSELQKKFASLAVKSRCPDFLFRKRAGRVSTPQEYLADVHINKLAELLS